MTHDAGSDGDDTFAAIVAGDLGIRRAALDELDEWTLVADRAGMLVVYPDGRVDAHVLLAGPGGSTSHPRTLSDEVVGRLTRDQPERWARPEFVVSGCPEPAAPAAALLASWAPAQKILHKEPVPWSSMLVSTSAPR